MKLVVNPLAVRVKMAEKNINQSELARISGLSRGAVITAMDGGNVHLSTVTAMGLALSCDPRDLLQVEEGQYEAE